MQSMNKLTRAFPSAYFRAATIATLCALFMPVLALLSQVLVLGFAVSLKALSSTLLIRKGLVLLGFDHVYASVFNRTLGNIEAQGLAVAGPVGDLLHLLAPGAFAPASQVMPGAWVTALIGDGVAVLAMAVAVTAADTMLVIVGLVLLYAGLRRGRVRQTSFALLCFLGLLLQARGVAGLLHHQFSVEDLEVMGFSQIFTKVFPLDPGSYRELIGGPLRSLAPYLVPSLVFAAVYGGLSTLLLFRARRRWRWGFGKAKTCAGMLRPLWLPRLTGRRLGSVMLIVLAVVTGAIVSPGFFPALANYNYALDEQDSSAQIAEALTPAQDASQEPLSNLADGQPRPSKVIIKGKDYVYSYTVNGQPEKIRGVGYNAMYSSLSQEQRAARYDWDFAEMKAAGINTMLGWGMENFDELLLSKAQAYGLGVIMPYTLPGGADYADPAYRQQVLKDVKQWVERYRRFPALRMWGIGNEVIHEIHPLNPRAKAFGEFYIQLADEVHKMDPDHPVIYRGAEDINIGPIREALKRDGVHRPWFVYGGNYFTYRVCEAMPDWRNKGMDIPMLVSEFAPSGLSPEDRPKGYLRMLKCIAEQRTSVLGAFVYVWTTDGPEAIDRVMGLVDSRGEPVGRSLWAVGRAFRHTGHSPSKN